MPDIFLYKGAANPNDIILRITTKAASLGAAKHVPLKYDPKEKREPAFSPKYYAKLRAEQAEVRKAAEAARVAIKKAQVAVKAKPQAIETPAVKADITVAAKALQFAHELQARLDEEEEQEAIMLLLKEDDALMRLLMN